MQPYLSSCSASGRERRLDRTHTPAEPTGQAAKEQADCAKQCGARHGLSRCVGGLRHLLLGVICCLPILLRILLNLRASILHRDILRTCYHLGCTFSRFCCLLRIAGDNCTHGYDSRISQGRWIVPRDRASDRLLDGGERVGYARHSYLGNGLCGRADRTGDVAKRIRHATIGSPKKPANSRTEEIKDHERHKCPGCQTMPACSRLPRNAGEPSSGVAASKCRQNG